MIQLCLKSAQDCVESQDYDYALSYLAEARMYARQGTSIRCKLIAIQCTVAIHALLPLELAVQMDGGMS